jgi:2-polyprenyl-6-methoxyphenol hydroxylase-like FAD-dependent oxidoreductase
MKVAVVGAGPTGLTAAISLARYDVDVTVYERREGSTELPSAHVVNCRTTEIFREMGVFDALTAAAAPADKMRYVTWSESLAGVRYGHLPYQGDVDQRAERLAASPARTINIGQDTLERVLCTHFEAGGGAVHFGHQVVGAEEAGDQARLAILDPAGSQISADFDVVLACDGASSPVRRALGIEMEGPASLMRIASAYFKADLAPYLGDDMGPVHFILNGDVRGAIIGFDLDRIWALMSPMSADKGPDDFTSPVMEELIRRAIGDPQVPLEMIAVGSWNLSAQVAAQFRKGRFFLVGDSAHRFPPSGGLGLNTGVQDAHNLAWKLAFVARGKAPLALLDSYDAERRPVAQRNCQQSVTNAMRLAEVDATIGVSIAEPVDPEVVRRPLAAVRGWSSAPGGLNEVACRERTQKAIDDQRPHFNSLAMEIGFSYEGEAAALPADHSQYQILAKGVRLPHFWLNEPAGVSSHDIVSRSAMTLITSDPAWKPLADQLTLDFRYVDGVGTAPPPCWREALGATLSGAVLVRPDGHVAWLHGRGPDEDAGEALSAVVRKWAGKCA